MKIRLRAPKETDLSTRRRLFYRSLAAAVLLATFLTACTQVASTATPSPRPPSQGIHTPEDYRLQYEGWPEEHRFAIDDEVKVLFAYPSGIIDWAWFASINHIPSASAVTLRRPYTFLDSQGNVSSKETGELLWGKEIMVRTHYESGEGETQLKAVLGDEALMRRILSRTGE